MSSTRERGDTTTFGLPPQGSPWAELPPSLPWDRPIADMPTFWLRCECKCGHSSALPLRLLAGQLGWRKTLREIVPRLRCSNPGCRAKPGKVLLQRTGGANVYEGSRECWYQLVPAGDEEMFPH
jgi:hypothetical protein